MADLDLLVGALNQADSLPFLFVGSGVSRRYLGHENWQGLMEWAADLTGRPFPYYAGQVSGDLPKAASLIAAAFYDTWWNDKRFARSRDRWADQCTDVATPLKIEVAERLAATAPPKDKDLRAELRLLGSCQVDGIVTTNYDTVLEETFPKHSIFVGQEDLLLRRSYQLGEIYKIHGSVTEPNSLVLTADDYAKFDETSAYLVAKLMSVFVEHPIVFLGYSLTDRNIRVILTSLLRCLSPEKVAEFKTRFIWIDYDPDAEGPEVSDHVMDLGEARLLPVLRVRTASFLQIFEVLNSLERVLPVGILRRVEAAVVGIVHSADPTRQIRVTDLASLEAMRDEDIVVGIGTDVVAAGAGPKGYLGYNRHDLLVDTLTDRGGFDPSQIVETTLPPILRQTPNAWVPVHKYVRRSGISASEIPVVVKRALERLPTSNYSVPPDAEKQSIKELVAEHGLTKALNLLCQIDREVIDTDALRTVLVDHLEELNGGDANLGTAFGKATVLFDYLKYGQEEAVDLESQGRPAKAAAIRSWASANGYPISERGRIPQDIRDAYLDAHPARS